MCPIWTSTAPSGFLLRLPEVLDRLRAAAPSHGWTSLTVSAYPGDPVGAAIRDGGADLVATKMGLAVADVPDADIELRPMLDERFERLLKLRIDRKSVV